MESAPLLSHTHIVPGIVALFHCGSTVIGTTSDPPDLMIFPLFFNVFIGLWVIDTEIRFPYRTGILNSPYFLIHIIRVPIDTCGTH